MAQRDRIDERESYQRLVQLSKEKGVGVGELCSVQIDGAEC